MIHPLCGASYATVRRAFAAAGPLRSDVAGTVRAIRWASASRAPLDWIERLTGPRRERLKADMPPPLFILGHWRSGTTHLYNILAESGQFAYPRPLDVGLPWNMLQFARAFERPLSALVPQSRAIDAVKVTPMAPQEDEVALANMTTVSFFHCLFFPFDLDRRLPAVLGFEDRTGPAWRERLETIELFTLKTFARYRKPVLIKNPAHTAYPDDLAALFPGVRFVHLTRDPYPTCRSMRHFYERLLPSLALQPYGHHDLDRIVVETFRDMGRLFEERATALAAPPMVRVTYGELDADPLGTVARIYRELALPGFETARPRFEDYLERLGEVPRNAFPEDPAFRARIDAALASAQGDGGGSPFAR